MVRVGSRSVGCELMNMLNTEYATIWKAKWTLPKTIYYFVSAIRAVAAFLSNRHQNRIVTPLGLISATFRTS